ncbi:MAG: 2Fe-2S iron-sulfur cluster-binding protein [Oceanicoccus sp.]
MIKVTFIEHSGDVHEVETETGSSLMEVAMNNDVPGIDADCGGGCSCATCHVYVDKEWLDKLNPPDAMEESMLGLNTMREDNSRLSCQIDTTDELDGLVVNLPEFQG